MIYNMLSFLAPVFVPIAPVIFFGWKVYTAVFEMTAQMWLAIPAGVLTAFGLEAVGILAGHVGMVAWRRGDTRTAVIAAAIMVAYVSIGSWELQGSVGMVVFWIAPLVYVLVALQELVRQDTEGDGVQLAFALEQQALDNEAKRALKSEVALAKIAHASTMQNVQIAMPAQANDNASNAAHECEKCGRAFKTVQALNAHAGRWCKA